MKVGLYKVLIKETPERGELKFYSRIGEADIESPVLTLTAKDWKGEEAEFEIDKAFSKEAGHYAYVKKTSSSLTPFDPDAIPDLPSADSGKSKGTSKITKPRNRRSKHGDTGKGEANSI